MQPIDRRDGGFTLIESAVALLIAAFIFVALGQTIATALRASEARRLEQQADALIAEAVEDVRNLAFPDVALDYLDPTRSGGLTFDSGSGPEPLVIVLDGSISPQVTSETIKSTQFKLTRYVTWVDDDVSDTSTEDYKRLTVVAQWDSRGQTRTEQRETLISVADPGAAAQTFGVRITPGFDSEFGGASSSVTFTHTLENIGSGTDIFELTVTNDQGWPVTMRSVDTGAAPVDSNGNGTPDTGELALTGDTFDLEVIVAVPTDEEFGSSSVTVLQVESAGDPSVLASAEDTTTSTGSGGGPVDVALFLKSGWALESTSPTGLYTTTSGPNDTTVTWAISPLQDWEAITDATLRLFVGPRGTCADGTVEYTATLRTTSETWGSQDSGPVAVSGCDPTTLSTVTIGITGDTLSSSETLFLDIAITKPSSGNPGKRGLTIGFDGEDADSSIAFQVTTP